MASSDEPASISRSRRYRLRSRVNGETYQIDVAFPPAAVKAATPLSVVYILDANTVFGIAAQTARFLQQADDAAPALIVGVGYCVDGVIRPREAYGALRTRDYTPSFDPEYFARLSEKEQVLPIRQAGGADDFLTFLIDELRPFIGSRYEVSANKQMLVGSSLGGLLSLHAMLTRPGAFCAYGANSPSIWWNRRELFAMEQRVAGSIADIPADLFMSVGGLETAPPWSMVGGVQQFAAQLRARNYPSLRLTSHVFEDETHTSVIPAALSRSLRTLLAAPGVR